MPRRRCVGCGRIAAKSELLRIAASAQDERAGARHPSRLAIADRSATMPGRGAYLCRESDLQLPAPDCLQRALRRGGIARALRSPVTVDPKLVESVSR